MKQSFSSYFFKLTVFTLALAAVFPKKKLKNRLGIFLLYKVWPKVFVSIWVPLVPMVVLKAAQFQRNRNWDELLDIVHMFFVGCFTLYMMCVVQITATNYQTTMDIFESKFRTNDKVPVKEYYIVIMLWVGITLCFLLFVGGCIYYKDSLVPLWVPFIDNDKELSDEVFYGVWIYELLAAPYIFITYTVWCPFITVSTVCICMELKYLSSAVDWYVSNKVLSEYDVQGEQYTLNPETRLIDTCRKDPDMLYFVKKVVEHHLTILSAIANVSRINSYVFLVQIIAAVVQSCFLTFNLYYTNNVEKVMLKSSPILVLSYYIMFLYCWNGQQLTNKNEELVAALYRLPWYKCAHSYRTSLLIMMEYLKRPVHLSGGGGIIKATLETFLTCCQQSFSYILVLKALTPEKGKALKDESLHQENFTTQNKVDGTW